ncbi:hypothetical protein DQ239_11025 [Blastococcus sp. TF02-09]|uniref:hypothetical protein n=1 Tax=Blastococcus sp. TF02-09 TaxID=2250576 RepID=UPI000DEB2CEE|nr:hypothetical protein [Blastococcus sp. TF02-9]RBY77410.1 hypothetical protein DQ239_11025 [Blastococcus sp. TF02-9]
MHLRQNTGHDLALSSHGYLPVSARRLAQKVLLILLSGRMWVRDDDGRRHDITGPTWVVWYPGEAVEYGASGTTVHWLFASPVGPVPPGSPRPGSLVRLRADERRGAVDALLVHYLDDSPDSSGRWSAVALVPDEGHGIYALTDVEVVEESDEDLHLWSFRPDLGRPVRLSDT